jgi:hypothetical protein
MFEEVCPFNYARMYIYKRRCGSRTAYNIPTMSKAQHLLVPILLSCASFAQVAAQTKEPAPTRTLEQCKADAYRNKAFPSLRN